jgi:hypothetical protein
MKTLTNILSHLCILLTFCNCENHSEIPENNVYLPDNEIIIQPMTYKENDIFPTPEQNCFLRIDLLEPDNYDFSKAIYYDTIPGAQIKFTPQTGLKFGHQAISVSKYGKSGLYDIHYKGGSIQLNILIK